MNQIISVIAFLALFFSIPAFASEQNVLNIYAWSGYLPNDVLAQFTKETGIKVNLSEYDGNETMYAKLKTNPHSGYDIVIPSNYYLLRMISEGMVQKIDKSKLPNLKNVNPELLNKQFDPHNNYSIPYLWGTTGIVINKKYINPKEVAAWKDFWDPKFKNQIMLPNDMRDVFSMALLALDYSVNDDNPEHIKRAYLKLKDLWPNIKIFNSDTEQTIYIDEDAIIGMGWNGDIYLSQAENPDIVFVYPREGFVIWIDCFAIAQNAPHLDNAHRFMNFTMRPDIAKKISAEVGYSSPNVEALKLFPKSIRNNPTINPSSSIFSRGKIQLNLDNKTLELYNKYWEMLKLGE